MGAGSRMSENGPGTDLSPRRYSFPRLPKLSLWLRDLGQSEKVLLGRRTKILGTTDAGRARRCKGPHRFSQNRPRTFVPALQRVAVAGKFKNELSRNFRGHSIFDFCNSIGHLTDIARCLTSVGNALKSGGRRAARWVAQSDRKTVDPTTNSKLNARRGMSPDLLTSQLYQRSFRAGASLLPDRRHAFSSLMFRGPEIGVPRLPLSARHRRPAPPGYPRTSW
jgi:hypothetical protein